MASLETAAGMLRFGLRIGLLTTTDAIRWAEAVIATSADPAIEVIELALIPDRRWNDVESALGLISDERDEGSGRLLMALIAHRVEQGLLEIREAIGMAYSLANDLLGYDDGVEWRIWYYRLDDADCGVDDAEDIEAGFREFLRDFVASLPEASGVLEGRCNGLALPG